MSKVTKMKKSTVKDPELIEMFNKMVGASDPDANIVIPKYKRIMDNCKEVITMLELFIKSPCMATFQNDFPKAIFEIKEFILSSKKQVAELELEKNDKILTSTELNELNSNPEKMKDMLHNIDSDYKIKNLGALYTKLKECALVKELVVTTRNLKNALMLEKARIKSAEHDLEDKNNLSAGFIQNSDGDFLVLLGFTSLDFKQLYYNANMNADFSKYILYILHLLYKKSMAVVKELTAPDIDVDKFSHVLVANIDDIRKHIPRCDKAFDKIKNSVSLLKDNFGEYYKDFISSQNPGIIIEGFVADVAKQSDSDPSTTAQFRTIIDFYKTNMQSKVKDPKVQNIFKLMGSNLDLLESQDKTGKPKSTKNEKK